MNRWDRLLFATTGHRQGPHIQFRLRISLAVNDVAPVPRPVGGKFGVIRLPQRRILPGAAGCLPIEVRNPIPIRSPDDTAPVRLPDGTQILRRIEGEARGGASGYAIQPEIGGAKLRIAAVDDKMLFVRGEPGLAITCQRLRRIDLLTTAIHPEVLAPLPVEAWIEDQHAVV